MGFKLRIREFIDKQLPAKYPRRRAAIIPLLHLAQKEFGYVPSEIEKLIANALHLSASHVHELVTFYTMYNESPVAKYHIQVSTNVSCMLLGSENSIGRGKRELQTLVRALGIGEVSFPVNRKALPIDDSHPVSIKDPNRCVLCGRCVPACSELAGKHNLSLGNRGKETIISSGLNQPFGETECSGCLACVMSCPTRALSERLLQFEGEKWEPRRIYL